MNRVTPISACLVIGLFIIAGLTIFPGAAAARLWTSASNPRLGVPLRGSLCSPILPETGRVPSPGRST
jgi:hypothetical protein